MKILHIIPSLAKGGAERLTLDLVIELSKRKGVEVALVIFRDQNTYSFLTREIDLYVIPSFVLPSLKGKMKKDAGQLQNFVNTYQPDVIHSHLFESEMVLSQIDCGKAKRVVHFHDNMIQLKRLKWHKILKKEKITNYFERKIILKTWKRQLLQTIAISKDTAHFIHKNIPKKIPTTLLFNAIDVKRFVDDKGIVKENRAVIIGSLVNKKGQDLAVMTIAELVKRGVELKLDILGDGPNFLKLKEMVESLNLQEFVILHGNVDYPEVYLHKAKIYLHTASYEPFGLVLLEAMAASLPVVCTDGFGNRDLIENGKNGYLISERDPKILADKIEFLLQRDDRRVEMGEYACNYAQKFDIKNYVDKLLEVYMQ